MAAAANETIDFVFTQYSLRNDGASQAEENGCPPIAIPAKGRARLECYAMAGGARAKNGDEAC
jgi:hypothetical protein